MRNGMTRKTEFVNRCELNRHMVLQNDQIYK